MDIHKPKPWHGLREFLKEYVIIVVGVLTALAAEQGVEWLHWRHVTAEAHDAIAFDFRIVLGASGFEDAQSTCTARRMEELADVLEQAQASHKLPPLGWSDQPGNAGWRFRSWSALTSGQTLAHMSNRDQLLVAAVENYLENLRDARGAEYEDWARLRTMAGPGRATSDAEIAGLRAALGSARLAAVRQKYGAHQIATLVANSGFLTRRQIDAAFDEGLAKARKVQFCQPTPPPPAHWRDLFGDYPLPGNIVRPGSTARLPEAGASGALTTER